MRRIAAAVLCVLIALPGCFAAAAAGDVCDYPQTDVMQIELFMQPYHYLQMISTTEKKKHPAVVSIDGGELLSIGVQVRGDSSLREGMETSAKRIPMELCFDYADPDGAFRGNPSLKLINCSTPARLIVQYIAMQAYVFSGVPAPRVTPAFIRINDTDFGLYLAVEDLNEAFMQSHFGGGSLYRPASKKDDPLRTVLFDQTEMLVKSDCGHRTLSQFNQAFQDGASVEPYLNTDEALRYLACDMFLTNEDGFLFGNRNYYLADDHGRLTLLPWDTDSVFMALAKGGYFPHYDRYDAPLFLLLMQDENNFARYRQYLQNLNDVFLNPDSFLPWLENLIRDLSPFFQRDVTIAMRSDDVFADLTTGDQMYDTLSGNLLLTFAVYHESVTAMLRGETEPLAADSFPKAERVQTIAVDPDPSVILRVCARYWELRRQAMIDLQGGDLLVSGIVFALGFSAAVLFVLIPVRGNAGGKKRRSAAADESG